MPRSTGNSTRASALGNYSVLLLLSGVFSSAAAAQGSDTTVRVAPAPAHAGIGQLVEEVSIGRASGAEEYTFAEVSDMALGPDGSIYVYDRTLVTLRQYDASGRYVRTLGRRGQGPGEYVVGGGLAVLQDGRVLLWDGSNHRINVYAPDGRNIDSWSTPASGTTVTGRTLTAGDGGMLYLRRRVAQRNTSGDGPRFQSYDAIVRIANDGTVIDTVAAPSFPLPFGVTATSPDGRSSTSGSIPFSPVPTWAISPRGYFVTGNPDRFAFELRIPRSGPGMSGGRSIPALWKEGDPVISIRREGVRPEPVSNAERSEARQDIEERMRRVDPSWSWGNREVPRTRPFYESIFVALDGRIWIGNLRESARVGSVSNNVGIGSGSGGTPPAAPTATRPAAPKHPVLYDIFEPDGGYVGRVEVPANVSTVLMRGEQIWGVQYDADDVPFIKRFRIAWP